MKNGEVVRSLGNKDVDSEEIRINTYTAEQIEQLLADNGIFPQVEAQPVSTELWDVKNEFIIDSDWTIKWYVLFHMIYVMLCDKILTEGCMAD